MPMTAKSATPGDIASHTLFAIQPTATEKYGNGDVKKQPNSCILCHYHENTPVEKLISEYNKMKKDYETYKYSKIY
jgi:hypothetical protein